MADARTPTASSSASSAQPSGESELLLPPPSPHLPTRYLWEQIAASLDPLELDEVSRVVGSPLVAACEDVYAELRALKEILSDYSAETDAQIRYCSAVKPHKASLLQLELSSLVESLRQRASADGTSFEALLPPRSSAQQRVLQKVLSTNSELASHRQIPETCERLSLRDLREGCSRPSTSSHPPTASRPPTTSRPPTASPRSLIASRVGGVEGKGAGAAAAAPAASSRPRTSSSAGANPQVLSLDDDTSGMMGLGDANASSNLSSSRPQTAGSGLSSASFAVEALESGRRTGGGLVIAQ
ncbi:MAG: hypothetical protein SGPRY_014199, partial [Prymnesium sp.]